MSVIQDPNPRFLLLLCSSRCLCSRLTVARSTSRPSQNYPQIMYASFSCAEYSCGPITGTLFFILFVLLGHIILMTVFSA